MKSLLTPLYIYSVLSKNNYRRYNILATTRAEAIRCLARLDNIPPDQALIMLSAAFITVLEVLK